MKQAKKRLSILSMLMVIVMVVSVFAGCGAEDESTSGSTVAPSESTAAPSESTAAPSESTAAPSESTTAPSESTTAPSGTAGDGNQEPTVPPIGYKFGFLQGTLNKVSYFNGQMSSSYLAMTENAEEAVDVYVETVTGGYRLYFMDGQTKTYIEVALRSGKTDKADPKLVTEPTCVYTYNEELNIYVTRLGNVEFFLGSYSNYDTISASALYYITGDKAADADETQFLARLYSEENLPTVPQRVEDNAEAILDAANALQEGKVLKGGQYSLTGKVVSIDTPYDEQYKNITITIQITDDEDNRTICCYRLKGTGIEDLAVGYTVTVTGVIRNYKGSIQFIDGCKPTTIISGTPDETPDPNPGQTPAAPQPAEVATEAELRAAVEAQKAKIKLTANIALTTKLSINYDVEIDGQNNTISGYPIYVNAAKVTIKNVKFQDADDENDRASFLSIGSAIETLLIDGCSFKDTQWDAVQITPASGKITISNCSFEQSKAVPSDNKSRFIHIEAGSYNANVEITLTKNTFGASTYITEALIDIDYINKAGINLGGDNVVVDTVGDIYICSESAARSMTVEEAYLALANVTPFEKPTTAKDILDAVENLEVNETLPGGTYSLTGEIIGVDTAWSSEYQNITVTIKVDGDTRSVKCYRLSGTGADKLKIGDTITVTGELVKFAYADSLDNWIYEFKAGCTVSNIVAAPEAPEADASIAFESKNRVSQSSDSQVWQCDGITVTNEKASSTSNVGDYTSPARFYKNSSLKIEYNGMTRIVVTCSTPTYATSLGKSLETNGTEVSVSGAVVTITFSTALNSFEFVLSDGQVRVNTIDIYTD